MFIGQKLVCTAKHVFPLRHKKNFFNLARTLQVDLNIDILEVSSNGDEKLKQQRKIARKKTFHHPRHPMNFCDEFAAYIEMKL